MKTPSDVQIFFICFILGVISWLLAGILYALNLYVLSGICILLGLFPIILCALFSLTIDNKSYDNHFNDKNNKQKNCNNEIFSKGGLK